VFLRRGAAGSSAEEVGAPPQRSRWLLRRVSTSDSAESSPTTLQSHHQQLSRVSPTNSPEFPHPPPGKEKWAHGRGYGSAISEMFPIFALRLK